MDQKKRHILETAKGLFLRQGFKATTMQSIADAGGVSKGAVYLQFRSKKDIFFEILLQSEDEFWEQIQQIRSDASKSSRDQLVGIFDLYLEYIQENRLLTELQVQEVGMELTEEMLEQTLILRVRWQQLFDDMIATLLGNEYDDWKGDLGFTVVAALEMYHACLVVDKIQIDKQSMIDYLMLLVETLGPALEKARKQGAIEPMFKPDYLAKRDKAVEDVEKKRQAEILEVIANMRKVMDGFNSLGGGDQLEICQESINILQQESQSENPNKALIQGMLAGVRGIAELSIHRKQLADLMNVRLV